MICAETERLSIRTFDPDDSPAFRALILRNEASEFAKYDIEWDLSDFAVFMKLVYFATSRTFFAVCLKDSGKLIGMVKIYPNSDTAKESYDLGYIFDSAYQGQGYALESCRALVDMVFQGSKTAYLTSDTPVIHTASVRLLERLGFRKMREGSDSMRDDADGTPITYTAGYYRLPREIWEKEKAAGAV